MNLVKGAKNFYHLFSGGEAREVLGRLLDLAYTIHERSKKLRRRALDAEQGYRDLQRDFEDYRNSREAVDVQIARGQLGAYKTTNQTLSARVTRINEKREGAERRNTIREQRLHALRGIIEQKDGHIGLLKQGRRKQRVAGYIRITRWFDAYNSIVLINPDNTVEYIGRRARQQLRIRGKDDKISEGLPCESEYIGQPYTKLFVVSQEQMPFLVDLFNTPYMQRGKKLHVECGDKVARKFIVDKFPLMIPRVLGKGVNHDISFIVLNAPSVTARLVYLFGDGFLDTQSNLQKLREAEKRAVAERRIEGMREEREALMGDAGIPVD